MRRGWKRRERVTPGGSGPSQIQVGKHVVSSQGPDPERFLVITNWFEALGERVGT